MVHIPLHDFHFGDKFSVQTISLLTRFETVSGLSRIGYPHGNALMYLGHEKHYISQGIGTIGYAHVGEWRDVILVPPLSNITVSKLVKV